MTMPFSRLRPGVFRKTTGNTTSDDSVVKGKQKESDTESVVSSIKTTHAESSSQHPEEELPTEDAQRGVKKAEAVTLTWSKTTLIAVFVK